MSKISAVLIVKNEAKCIEKCLKSVELADEIIVCDTWSSDITPKIAETLWATVKYFEWEDDFSSARNYAKSFASNEWVLSIDADEVLEEWWIDKIKTLIRSLDCDADGVYIEMDNWYWAKSNAIRVFKKHLNWNWKIHEAITPNKAVYTDINIVYWRSPAHDLDPDIDLRIMEKVYKETPDNTRNMFYLAREYYYYKRYNEAEKMYLDYIKKSNFFIEITDAFFMLWKIYWENGKWQWELSREMLMRAIIRNPNFRAAYVLLSEQMLDEKKRITFLRLAQVADNSWLLFIH